MGVHAAQKIIVVFAAETVPLPKIIVERSGICDEHSRTALPADLILKRQIGGNAVHDVRHAFKYGRPKAGLNGGLIDLIDKASFR
jgi:hypothetical protein